jgi:hypothetical protein
MASLGQILTDLREEVIQRVYLLTPEMHSSQGWEAFEVEESQRNLITETPGKIRLFQVGDWRWSPLTIGHTNRRYVVVGAITIGYPQGDDYVTAAAADSDIIARSLDNNSTTVTGCDYRIIRIEEEIPVEYDEENQWQWIRLPLEAVVETTS